MSSTRAWWMCPLGLALIVVFWGCNFEYTNSGCEMRSSDRPINANSDAASLQSACDRNVKNACNNLGVKYLNGVGVAVDYPRALSLFKQACDHGDQLGCVRCRDEHRLPQPGLDVRPRQDSDG